VPRPSELHVSYGRSENARYNIIQLEAHRRRNFIHVYEARRNRFEDIKFFIATAVKFVVTRNLQLELSQSYESYFVARVDGIWQPIFRGSTDVLGAGLKYWDWQGF
jgi:hypothetical protein